MSEALNDLPSNHHWEESLHQPGMLIGLDEREKQTPTVSATPLAFQDLLTKTTSFYPNDIN